MHLNYLKIENEVWQEFSQKLESAKTLQDAKKLAERDSDSPGGRFFSNLRTMLSMLLMPENVRRSLGCTSIVASGVEERELLLYFGLVQRLEKTRELIPELGEVARRDLTAAIDVWRKLEAAHRLVVLGRRQGIQDARIDEALRNAGLPRIVDRGNHGKAGVVAAKGHLWLGETHDFGEG